MQSKLRLTTELLFRDTRPQAGSIVVSCGHGPGRRADLLNYDCMRPLAKRCSEASPSGVSPRPL